jgi:hypothetical protein
LPYWKTDLIGFQQGWSDFSPSDQKDNKKGDIRYTALSASFLKVDSYFILPF